MPRRNKKARIKHHNELKESTAVLVKIEQRKDGISPGRLVAAAEWKSLKAKEA